MARFPHPRQVVCNPLVFGFQLDPKEVSPRGVSFDFKIQKRMPFCVNPGLYATKDCDKVSGDKKYVPAMIIQAGLARAFDDFKEKLETQMCGSDIAATQYNRPECQLMISRLAEYMPEFPALLPADYNSTNAHGMRPGSTR